MSDSGRLGAIAEEFVRAAQYGESPNIEDYARRHPELAERIRELFPTLLLLEQAAGGNSGDEPPSFGPYQIEGRLGTGGMGIVYRATDTRLDRTVAIKVLPPDITPSPAARQRFEREAKAIAALNHPHICTLHDIGTHEGINFLVLEHLEGETLAERLEKGPLPVAHALEYAVQIADALEKAHRAGIVHRDLKPANIMLTANGPKLLDFGLAKLRQPSITSAPETADSTRTEPLTASGAVVGTLAYMSPEQVQGKPADARADLFAFGAVLYEMLTGQCPFEADSQAGLVAAILEREATPISELRRELPPGLNRIIETCLAKDPDERWQSATDLKRQLLWLSDSPAIGSPPATGRQRLAWGIATAAVGLSVVLLMWPPAARDVVDTPGARMTVEVPAGQALEIAGSRRSFSLAPDGTKIVYAAYEGSQKQLFIRELASFEARALPGTEGARFPIFSPDGRWVAFFAGGALRKVAVDGGPSLKVADVPEFGFGAAWGLEKTIVFAVAGGGLMEVSADGGTPSPVVSDSEEFNAGAHRWPRFLPDGRGLLSRTSEGPQGVLDWKTRRWRSFDTGPHPVPVQSGQTSYLLSGHIVYHVGRGEIHAAPFDLEAQDVTGAPVPVLADVYRAPNSGAAFFDVADNGTLVYVAQRFERRLVEVDRSGRRQPLTAERRGFRTPHLSPDGRFVAVALLPRPNQIWVYDLERGTSQHLAQGLSLDWSRDGRRITYAGGGIYSRAADASDEPVAVLDGLGRGVNDWSPDEQLLLITRANDDNTYDIEFLDSEGRIRPLVSTPAHELGSRFHPSGRWFSYYSNESGRPEVYVRPFPDAHSSRQQVSTNGGVNGRWSRNGDELFYLSRGPATGRAEASVWVVSVTEHEDRLEFGVPRFLFHGPFDRTEGFDIFPDGQRFVMTEVGPDSIPNRFQVVTRWTDELERRFSQE